MPYTPLVLLLTSRERKRRDAPCDRVSNQRQPLWKWKLLEIGVLLVTGGTEYLCRILNPRTFGRRAEVLAGRREKRYPGFGAMIAETLLRASRLRGSVRASVLSRSREFSRKQGTVLSVTGSQARLSSRGGATWTPGGFQAPPRTTRNPWDFSRGSSRYRGTVLIFSHARRASADPLPLHDHAF